MLMTKPRLATRVALFALASALATPAIAGDVRGIVVDESDTVALDSAEVKIIELNRSASTERDGSFLFADVPAGEYTIEARYVGAQTTRQTITVPATGTIDITLQLASEDGETILVIGQRANQASALSRKRESDVVSDVISRDAIGQFPDQNVAESLRRVPGVNVLNDQGEGRFVSVRGLDPDLVSTSLNGVRVPSPESDVRSVALDVISSDIIESIEVKKSLTPDMDGDTIGASVEIETTSAFDRRKSLLTAKIEGSYNDYADYISPKGSVDFATRLGDNVGVSGGLSYYKRKFETDNIEADDYTDANGIVPTTVEYRDYDVERERISASLNFDFRVGDSTKLYARGIYSQFDDQEYRRRTTFDLGDFEDFGPTTITANGATFSDATVADPEDPTEDLRQRIGVERDIKDRFESQKIRTLVLGGESDWGDWFAEYSGSWAKSSETENGSIDPAEFRQRFDDDGLTLGFDYSDPRRPIYSVIADPGTFYDPSEYELNDIELTALSDAQDEEYAAKFDLGRRFAMDRGEFTVQAGFKGRWRDKTYNKDVEFYEYDGPGTFSLANVLGTQTYRITDMSPVASFTGASDYFRANFGDFELVPVDSAFDSAVEDYSVSEDILAGYLLARYDSSTLRVIGGVRFENTRNSILGNTVTLIEEDGTLPGGGTAGEDTVVVSPVAFEKDYDSWLPSLNIRWEAQPNLILRLAGYKSLVRPKLGKLAPRFAVEQNDDDEREGEFGNPALDPYRAWNFDASLEYYMNSNGALTGAVFYKDIKDYIVDTVQRDGVFNGIAYDEAVIPINGDEAKVFGFEASFAQSLSFLPSPLDGLLVQANYTYTDATGTVFTDGDQTDPREIPLPATARHTFNVVLGYDKGPLDIRLAGTYRDRYLDEIADEAALDRYVDNHFQLDLSAKYKLTKNIKLFYEWININNAKYYAYNNFGGQRNPYQFEEYSWTMKGGVRVTF
jgi:TonB-dependent receptor